MKTSRVILLFWLPLILIILSTGCATQLPLVQTWRDPQFSPTPTDKIALTDRQDPSPQEEALSRLLVTELQSEGFALTSPDQADYLINCIFDESTERKQVVSHSGYNQTTHGPPTPQTAEQARAMSYLPLPPPPDRTTTYSFTSKSILLHLYTNPKTHAGKFQLAWQGSINVDQSVPAGGEERAVPDTKRGKQARELSDDVGGFMIDEPDQDDDR